MASSHDAAFGGAALKQRILTSEQLILGEKVQKILGDLGIPKPFAVIAVEAGWIELGQALAIVTGLRKLGIDHPEVKTRESSEADESVLERLSPSARKKLETASRTLASLFYARGAGTLALDQGAAPPPPPRGARKAGDPTPTPSPARRAKPVVVAPAPPPPRKNSALGAILAVAAALIAIVGLIMVKKGKPPAPEPEPPPPVVKKAPPPPKPPVPPPKAPPAPTEEETPDVTPEEPSTDAVVEAKRKQYIEEREREAERLFGEVKGLLAEGRPASARGKLRQLTKEFGWTEFVKLRGDEIARLLKETDAEPSPGMPDEPSGPEPVAEGPALPGMAAALKRLDEGTSADARRAAGAKSRLAGTKSDLVLRGGKVVKGAEIVDLTREDLRVRGEIDGEKVDFLLAWAALDAPTFLSVQKQIAKGQGAAGLFEMGRAAVQRRLWKDAKAAFDECAKVDPAWKPRLPDIAAVLADPAILRGAARRLGDRRLLVEYSFGDAEQSADFAPLAGTTGTLTVAAGTLKVAGKETALWSLKDVEFDGDIAIDFEFEGPGEAAIGFAAAGEGQKSIFYFGSGKSRFDEAKPGSPESSLPFQQAASQGTPVRIERLGSILRVWQGDRVLSSAVGAGWTGPRRLILGARGEAAIRNLSVAGTVGAGEMTKRLGPLERLEGGAHAGDFRLEPAAADAEAASRAALAEAALEVGQLEESWTLADEAVTRSPADGLAVAIRGLIRLAQGETRLAVADADFALALDPCRGEVAIRARRILSALRGPVAAGAFRRQEIGPWDLRTDGTPERLKHFAGKLDEAGKRFSEALKDAGPAPKGVRAAVFASRDAWLAYSETSVGREAAVVDVPGAERELVRLAALSYLRAAVAAAPAWFEEGMAAHLAGEAASAEMKLLLPQSAPLDALLKKSASDFAESDRLQSASFVRFLLAGAHKGIIPDLLKKLSHGVPAIEAFSGKSISNLDAEWRKWAATDGGN